MARLPEEVSLDPPYDSDLKGILAFKCFGDAEQTLLRLEAMRQKYRAETDDKGLRYCRDLALLGRKRAELVSRNPRVRSAIRRQKSEIAFWFRVWLETPELFRDWLELRKGTRSFRQLCESEGSSQGR